MFVFVVFVFIFVIVVILVLFVSKDDKYFGFIFEFFFVVYMGYFFIIV